MLKWWLERDPLSINLASQPFPTFSNPFPTFHTQKSLPARGIDVFPFLINLWLECGPLSWDFTSFNLYITPRGDPTHSTSLIPSFYLIFDLVECSPRELHPPFLSLQWKLVFIGLRLFLYPNTDPTTSLMGFVWSQHLSLISHPSLPFPHPKWCALQEKWALPLLGTQPNNF